MPEQKPPAPDPRELSYDFWWEQMSAQNCCIDAANRFAIGALITAMLSLAVSVAVSVALIMQ